ncbi:uncharacterized mitochondrial protein AtMg00810-like [Quercus suber]|uniref:uncharacterized mitochondrial protein AtMg00810-like n=1 Tax=Quercus suber TaxID=58331 RepID=UPI0032DF934F
MVDLPPGQSVVGYRWVYKIKTKTDGSVERYKAHLVAKGFTQEYGIDYEETFAPVARLISVRCLIAVADVRHWPLYQMDVKNAFLNGDLQEKGFTSSPHDTTLFVRRSSAGITFILLYVDEMIITGDDSAGIHSLQHFLSQHFTMKDLGTLSYFLGLEVTSSFDGYYHSQAKYAFDVFSKAGITNNKTVSTPLEYNAKLTPLDGEPISDATRYRQLVGSLIYLIVTCPDISHAVDMVSKFMDAPRSVHYAAVLRILRYVKGTLYHGLHYSSRSSLKLHAYSDADWAGDPTDRCSIIGFCFMLGTSLVLWCSKKQDVVSRFSTEAEYRALADTTCKLVWLR